MLLVTLAAAACSLFVFATSASAIPTPPFTQCPAVGASPSCGVLIEFTDQGTNILEDTSIGPYDGSDDTLVGAQNDSSATVNSVTLSGVGAFGLPLFGFEGDGICAGYLIDPGCPFGPTGYEGPGTSFQNISADQTTGDVVFTNGLAPGASAFFSLEDRLSASLITVISLTPPTASNSLGTSHTVTATITKGGAPVTGKLVTFSVVSGPDNGASGTCSPVNCTTDASGQVTFTYTNNGTAGTDAISASFVNDQGNNQSATATKDWVKPPNQDPNCSAVKANPKSLWPPNHKYQLITLSGATDADGDPVTLTVTGVTQDEPLNGLGDGDTSPDAKSGPSSHKVYLRAERSGLRDGRVYQVSFTGSDGKGGTIFQQAPCPETAAEADARAKEKERIQAEEAKKKEDAARKKEETIQKAKDRDKAYVEGEAQRAEERKKAAEAEKKIIEGARQDAGAAAGTPAAAAADAAAAKAGSAIEGVPSDIAALYPGDWRDTPHGGISTAFKNNLIKGCGKYKFRNSANQGGPMLVQCTEAGTKPAFYYVYPTTGGVTPARF